MSTKDPATQAREAVTNLSDVLALSPEATARAILPHLIEIEKLCIKPNEAPTALQRELLRNRLVPVVTKSLGRICSQSLEAPDQDEIIICIGAGFNILTRSLRGRAWIMQALDSGFLAIFLGSGIWIARLGHEAWASICSTTFTLLYQNLVFRSVLRSLAVVMKNSEELDKLAETSFLTAQWVPFKSEAARFFGHKSTFDEDKKNSEEPGFLGCSNIDVGVAM